MQSEQHIVFGIIYVPPTQSRFLNEDEFEIFQNEITDIHRPVTPMYNRNQYQI